MKIQTPSSKITSPSPEPYYGGSPSSNPGQKYNGPSGHVTNNYATMQLKDGTNDILCRAFSMTLENETKSWYNRLSTGSIHSY